MCTTAATFPWKAGDVMLVENACVHQHFNDSKDEEAILLVFKAKPLFLFMHLLFQKNRRMAVEDSTQRRGELQAAE
jgi:gentisate 1,2-dioxygenase